jgi:hypothetical protein
LKTNCERVGKNLKRHKKFMMVLKNKKNQDRQDCMFKKKLYPPNIKVKTCKILQMSKDLGK